MDQEYWESLILSMKLEKPQKTLFMITKEKNWSSILWRLVGYLDLVTICKTVKRELWKETTIIQFPQIVSNMIIGENGIGSNYHTLDNDPIDRFNDPRIEVEIFPDAWNNTSTNISCDILNYTSGLRKFSTEQEARLFASNVYSELLTKLNNKLSERVIQRLLSL